MAGRGASEHLDAPHRTESAVGTEAYALGQKLEEAFEENGSRGNSSHSFSSAKSRWRRLKLTLPEKGLAVETQAANDDAS